MTISMKRRPVTGLLTCLAAAAGIAVFPLRADVTIRCTPNGANQTVCRIDEPIVTEKTHPYPQVTFQAGDQVTVNAGGCVQTGGMGATWKRYVDPAGPNSNKYYWGTISIPGATPGFIRISDAMKKPWTVSAGISGPLVLELGYVDDVYHDNGYYSHDDGTGNQCKNVGNAFVSLTITHQPGTTFSCAGSSGNGPLDLTWSGCDQNGFPLNPKFQNQVSHPGVSPAPPAVCPSAVHTVQMNNYPVTYIQFPNSCIQWPVTYDSGAICGPHVNYFAVTYQSDTVNWWKKSTAGTDDDYNYFMLMPNHEAETSTEGIEIEFDSDETIDRFSSPLWNRFHSLVDNHNSEAQALVFHKTAVVTSLFGLDCGHAGCGSEQHPAYAMAVDIDNSNLGDDQWGVFARNWGDEGFCSDDEHSLPGNDLKVVIPWLPGATAAAIGPDTQFYPFSNSDSGAPVPSPQIIMATGQGILLDFTLPDPGAQMGIEGEVHLQWTLPAAARTTIFSKRVAPPAILPVPVEEGERPENRIATTISGLPAAQAQALRSRIAAAVVPRPVVKQAKLAMRPVQMVAKLPQPPHLARPVVPQTVPNPRIAQQHQAMRTALCETFKNNVPGYPALCQPKPPGR
jgi:hypothetical protein